MDLLAYLVLPAGLVDGFMAARSIADRFPAVFDQIVLCDFIVEGHFARHVRSMRELYGSRLAALRQAIDGRCELLELAPECAGLEIVGWLPPDIDDRRAAAAAAQRGVEVRPLSLYVLKHRIPNGLVLGFAAVEVGDIESGLDRLAAALNAARKDRFA